MNKEALGVFIAETRRERDLLQRDLADRLHVTDKAVSKWERGLSYPDVTLLEPLAEALGLGVDELLACRRQAPADRGEGGESMKTLLTISGDSLRREKRRGRQVLAALVGLLLAALAAVYLCAFYVTEQRETSILLTETVGRSSYLYVQEEGHLLRLRCRGVDLTDLPLTDQWGCAIRYRLDCRWDRRTYQGTVSACQPTGSVSLGGLPDTTFEVETMPLLGYPAVCFAPENYYPDPYGEPRGRIFLCDVRFWTVDAAGEEAQQVLAVEDCLSAAVADVDGDGENEVVARTRWSEKPYTVYDRSAQTGEIAETWPDSLETVAQGLPETARADLLAGLRRQLRCAWET